MANKLTEVVITVQVAFKAPPSTSRATRKKKSESDIKELDPPPSRKAKITTTAAKKEEEPTSSSTKPLRRGRGAASKTELPSSSTKSRTRLISENVVYPGLKTKNAGEAAMPSYQEEDQPFIRRPKKAKNATGHAKCNQIPEGTIFKGTNKKEIIVEKE